MATSSRTGTELNVSSRDPSGGSRAARRLRRSGRVPGVLYGGGDDPVHFDVDARELRHALAARGAVLDVRLDGEGTSAVLKDAQRHPVRGETMHVDLVRVQLDVKIQSVVPVELTGADDAPGVREGGVLEQVVREVTVEALPTDIPESVVHDVSGLQINETVPVSALRAPDGVEIVLGDTEGEEEAVLATVTAPTIDAQAEDEAEEAIEQETGVVGEGAGALEGSEADADPGDVPADAGDASSE